MTKKYINEDQVKEALDINDFRHISKDKIMEFASLLPDMDKDVALKIIDQFQFYVDGMINIIDQLKKQCSEALESNDKSQKQSLDSYNMILTELSKILQKDDISSEERKELTEQMIEIADKMAKKDSENKEFIKSIIKNLSQFGTVALFVGAVILGVNVKGIKLPQIKK